MNIQQAVRQLEETICAYTAKTKDGVPVIPVSAQRPVYLEGPPGVGKTAILQQIAERLKMGLVSYTMTHHTRQSALGLPVIEKRRFEGVEYSVTEYTMSEIVAEIYRHMEQTGRRTGILFLDEINCVSETLHPAMLELLQHKRFGRHRLPEGWVIVCAGNPERYNRSARAFDAVTLDRVRLMRIEPDAEAWQEYAAKIGVHASIRAYLRLRPEDFYVSEGENIVTPRSWCDLSEMIAALDAAGKAVNGLLFEQYLQCACVCEQFSMYYVLCESVSKRFQLDAILFDGILSGAEHFAAAPFDEALCCAEMLSGRTEQCAKEARDAAKRAQRLAYFVEAALCEADGASLAKVCQAQMERREHALKVRKEVGALTAEEEAQENAVHASIRAAMAVMLGEEDPAAALKAQAESAAKAADALQRRSEAVRQNARAFAERAFPGDSFQAILCRELLEKAGD